MINLQVGNNTTSTAAENVLPPERIEAFKAAENVTRRSGMTQILNALGTYRSQTGSLPPEITETEMKIAKSRVDLCKILIPKYLPEVPRDPRIKATPDQTQILSSSIKDCDSDYDTGYLIKKNGDHIVISAPFSEGEIVVVTQ